MEDQLEYFERKVRDLHAENAQLRSRLGNSSFTRPQPIPQAVLQLSMRNQRLEREACKYERSIKMDLSSYVSESLVQGECLYRNRYSQMLNRPKNHYRVYY